jgi:hypothetical protein
MAESSPRDVSIKVAALLVAIVLIGIPFARYVKDRLEPRPRAEDLMRSVTITQCGPGLSAVYSVRNRGAGRARYRFTIEFEDSGGAVVNKAVETTEALLPGDSFHGDVRLRRLSGQTTTPPVVRCVVRKTSRIRV